MNQAIFDATTIKYGDALYFLKLAYEKALQITDASVEGLVRYDSPLLNDFYTSTCFVIGKLLQRKDFETLKNGTEYLFPTLLGYKELDTEWSASRSNAYVFLTKIESEWLNAGKPTFEIPSALQAVFDDIEKAIKSYRVLVDKADIILKNNAEESTSVRLIAKDKLGNFLYNEKPILMGKDTLHYQIFNALFSHADQNGFLSYEGIAKYIDNKKKEDWNDDAKRNKRIQDAVSNQLFRSAKVNEKDFKNVVLDGTLLVEVIRGKGLKLNNPQI